MLWNNNIVGHPHIWLIMLRVKFGLISHKDLLMPLNMDEIHVQSAMFDTPIRWSIVYGLPNGSDPIAMSQDPAQCSYTYMLYIHNKGVIYQVYIYLRDLCPLDVCISEMVTVCVTYVANFINPIRNYQTICVFMRITTTACI